LAAPSKSGEKLLVIQPLPGIGDTIWHLPHLKALSNATPSKKITLLTKSRSLAKQLLSETTFIKEVLYLSPDKEHHFGILGPFNLGKFLAPFKFDRVWILHNSARYSIACWWAGIPNRIGFGIGWQDAFLTSAHTLSKNDKKLNAIEKSTRLLQLNNITIHDDKPTLNFSEAILKSAAQNLPKGKALSIALAIGSSEPRKQWGTENFIKLIEKLNNKLNPNIVLVGGKEDAEMARSISLHFSNPIWIKTLINYPILEAAAVTKFCHVCIGNDTGILNVAAAAGTHAFGIFCGSKPLNPDPLITPIEDNERNRGKLQTTVTPEMILEVLSASGFVK
tara:strand:+ start:1290 stop:2294 length:1005 start_codon:yes stop_codon:yes gene_type:complete